MATVDYTTWVTDSVEHHAKIEDPPARPHWPGGRTRSPEHRLTRCGAAPLAKDSGGARRHCLEASTRGAQHNHEPFLMELLVETPVIAPGSQEHSGEKRDQEQLPYPTPRPDDRL
jgi:hypothetical protein